MQKLIFMLAVLLHILYLQATALACTSFLVKDDIRPLMGKSYDWDLGHGIVVVNQRGRGKTGLAAKKTDRPPTWTSQYGSITFNQYGREFPVGGINEAGLAVEVLWNFSVEYPDPDARPSLNELQWIQYQLDNYASVKEMIAHADSIRISGLYAKVHYLAVDKQNHSASFSYIDGKLVINEDTLAITNTTLSESLSYLEKFTGFNGTLAIPEGKDSLDRFVIARSMLAAGDQAVTANDDIISFAFNILDEVETPGYTQWQIVYDLAGREIHFRTAKNDRIRRIRLTEFNFSCTEAVLGFSIDNKGNIFSNLRGLFGNSSQLDDVSNSFSQLTDLQNAQMVTRAAEPILSAIPEGITTKFVEYPASTYCEDSLAQRTDLANNSL